MRFQIVTISEVRKNKYKPRNAAPEPINISDTLTEEMNEFVSFCTRFALSFDKISCTSAKFK